ncbi:hypothetical protein C8Q79DRAFT_647264 [Trametes meyenii]|nr:hypothetical protein C8Q79DRAFT_647264 [Trametes meyenii]
MPVLSPSTLPEQQSHLHRGPDATHRTNDPSSNTGRRTSRSLGNPVFPLLRVLNGRRPLGLGLSLQTPTWNCHHSPSTASSPSPAQSRLPLWRVLPAGPWLLDTPTPFRLRSCVNASRVAVSTAWLAATMRSRLALLHTLTGTVLQVPVRDRVPTESNSTHASRDIGAIPRLHRPHCNRRTDMSRALYLAHVQHMIARALPSLRS